MRKNILKENVYMENELSKKVREEKAITLISLIVTIVILLILAGVSIALLTGENGIIAKAQLAKEKTNEAQNDDDKRLKELESKVAEYESIGSSRDTVILTAEQYNNIISTANKYPDYENKQKITFTDKSYTVENDGYIQVYFTYSTGGSEVRDSLKINDSEVFLNYMPIRWSNVYTPLFLVKKGDVVTYTNTAHNVFGYYYNYR